MLTRGVYGYNCGVHRPHYIFVCNKFTFEQIIIYFENNDNSVFFALSLVLILKILFDFYLVPSI